MNLFIVRTLAAATLVASIVYANAVKAGSPPPPPWKPTNHLRIYFAYNPDLVAKHHIGNMCAKYSWYLCTPQGRAQASIDYLNAVLRASGANVKAVVAGASVLKRNVRHQDLYRNDNRASLVSLRDKHEAQLLMVVNSTRGRSGQRGGVVPTEGLGWFTAGFENQEKHIFTHEVGHMLGAMHDVSDNDTDLKPIVPYAVGWKSRSHATLMLLAPVTVLDRFSDHEQWHGAPDRSVARWLREKYGRYRH